MEKKTIGKFISALRRANGMTQKELGDRLFVSDKTVSRWECDESTPDLALIPSIAEIFGITADELLRGERKSAAESDDEEDVSHTSDKGEKQLRLMLDLRQKRHRNLSYISIALAIAAILAAMLIDLGFYKALIAFCVGCVFLLAGVLLQVILTNNALLSSVEEEVYEKDYAQVNRGLRWASIRVYLLHLGVFVFLLPLVLISTYGNGLAFGSWLIYGLLFLAIAFVLGYISYRLIFTRLFIQKGLLDDNGDARRKDRAEKRLMLRVGAVMLLLALLLGGGIMAVNLLDVTSFCSGETFSNYDDFVLFMEESLGKSVHQHTDQNGNIIVNVNPEISMDVSIDDDYTLKDYPIHTVEDKNGNILCEYPYNSDYIAEIHFSFEESDDGLPVTVYTKIDFSSGYLAKESTLSVLAVVLALSEGACLVWYFCAALRIRKKEK